MTKALLSGLMILSTLAQAAMPVRVAAKAWMGRNPTVNKLAGGMYKGQELPKLTAKLANPAAPIGTQVLEGGDQAAAAEAAQLSETARTAPLGDSAETAQTGDYAGRVESALENPTGFAARTGYMKRVFLGLVTAAALMMPIDLPAQTLGQQPVKQAVVELATPQIKAASIQEKQGYVVVDDVNSMVAAAKQKHRPLIVMKGINLSDAQLTKMAKFLQGRQWTVVLMDDASGQRWTAADGSVKRDDYAVEFAIGEGLMNTDGVKSFTHPLTGQPSGKAFFIALNQKALVYWGSTAQDVQQLGDQQFANNLDRWAKANLRAGLNVAGAVEETVSNIDELVDAAIKADFKSAPEKIAGAQSKLDELGRAAAKFRQSHPKSSLGRSDIASLKAGIAAAQDALSGKRPWDAAAQADAVASQIHARLDAMANYEGLVASAKDEAKRGLADVAALEAAAASARSSFPKAVGTLLNPDVKALREHLDAASSSASDDPRRSLTASKAAREKIASLVAEIRAYPEFETSLSQAESRYKSLSKLERARAAASQLLSAKQSLESARQLWTEGQPGFQQKLDEARSQLDSGERAVASADARARAAFITLATVLSLASLGLFLLGLFLHLKVKPVRMRVEGFYKDWDTRLDDRLKEMNGALQQRLSTWAGPAEGEGKRDHAGRTKKLADDARDAVGTYDVLWTLANNTLDAAEKLVHPKGFGGRVYNYFLSKRYVQAEAKLSKELLRFSGENGMAAVFGVEEASHKDRLYGNPKEKDIQLTFEQLIAKLNATARTADEALEKIEKSTEAIGSTKEKAEAVIAKLSGEVKQGLEKGGASDGLFLLPSLFAVVVPAALKVLEKFQEKQVKDPVGAMETTGAESARLTTEALGLADLVLSARLGLLPKIAETSKALSSQGLATEWIDKSLNKLSGRAERLAALAVGESIAEKAAKLKEDLAALSGQAAEAARLAALLKDLSETRVVAADRKIAEGRKAVSEALGLELETALAEKDFNPTDRTDGARRQAAAMAQALGAGDVKTASANLAEADKLMGEAQFIVERSLKQLADNAAETATRLAETGRLETLIPEREAILESIERDFAPSVLALNSGDPAHPSADGTVKNNIQEANANLASAKEKQAKAAAAFRAGRLIEADMLLDQIGGHHEFMAHRLGEIAEKRARLDAAVADNASKSLELRSTLTSFQQEYVEDKRTMKPSLSAYKKAASDYEEAKALIEARKGDPFKAQAALSALAAALKQFELMAKNDRDVYAEAKNSLAAAQRQLDAALVQADSAKKDAHGDSSAIKQGYRDIAELEKALSEADSELSKAHNDFNAVDKEADRITAAASKVAAVIRNELAEAEEAASGISRAASKVREASGWTGSYGVSIPGSPGSGALDRARELLRNGKYKEAQSEAGSAYSTAAGAISQAEAEESRRRRAEEERQRRERERRAAEERARRQRSSGSSYGGGGFGGGSSGGGRSSYGGGSSSGGGRSSW